MSNGNTNRNPQGNRNKGGGNQQRRRRGSNQGGGGNRQQQQRVVSGPVMTSLGESTYEGVFDHGNDGYGIWFDGIVREDPMYRQFWKGTGTRPIYVRFDEDTIVISREQPQRGESAQFQEQEPDANAPEVGNEAEAPAPAVYTAEQAAQLFADEAAGRTPGSGSIVVNGAESDVDDDDSASAEDDVAAPEPAVRRRVSTRRSTTAAANDDVVAPRRPTRAKRTPPIASEDSVGDANTDSE